MNRRNHWFQGLIGLALLAVLTAGLAMLVRHVPTQVQTGQEKAPTVALAQAPSQDLPLPTPLPTDTAEPPTPTIPPVPTLLPTPVVTPIPLAKPPIIPLPTQGTKPYTIIWRDNNVIYAINNDGSNQRQLIDVHAKTSLYLPTCYILHSPVGKFKFLSYCLL